MNIDNLINLAGDWAGDPDVTMEEWTILADLLDILRPGWNLLPIGEPLRAGTAPQ